MSDKVLNLLLYTFDLRLIENPGIFKIQFSKVYSAFLKHIKRYSEIHTYSCIIQAFKYNKEYSKPYVTAAYLDSAYLES